MVKHILRQIWVECGICMHTLSFAMVLSYPSCLLPGLRVEGSPIKVDIAAASWLASIVSVSAPVILCITAYLMDSYGRKRVLLLMGILDTIAWLVIYWSNDLSTLMFGRFLSGFSTVSSYVLVPTICAEYCAPELRGVFSTFKSLNYFIGGLLMHVLTHFFSWRTVALCGTIPSVVCILCNMTWPESPSWLLAKNRFVECEESFYWLRGTDDKAVQEVESMLRAQKERVLKKQYNLSRKQKLVMFLRKFKRKDFLKPFFITIFASILKESTGRNLFLAYATDVTSQLFSDKSYQFMCIVGIDLLTIGSVGISCVLVKIMGRRTLLVVSGVPTMVFLLTASLLIFLSSRSIITEPPFFIVPIIVCLYFISGSIGISPLAFVIIGEIFPLPHRETSVAVSGNILSLAVFATMKLTPYMLEYLRLDGTFLVMAGFMLISLIYLRLALPETRDRTLQEIEDYFNYGRFLDEHDVKGRHNETKVMLRDKFTDQA